MGYKEARELELLPEEIDELNLKIAELEITLDDPTFYEKDPVEFDRTVGQLQEARHSLQHKEERWLELLEKEESLKANEDTK